MLVDSRDIARASKRKRQLTLIPTLATCAVIGLVNQAVAWYAASAVLAFLFAMRKPLSGAIAGIGGAVASAMLVVGRRRAADAGADPRRHAAVSPPDDTGGGVNALWLLAIRRRCRCRCLILAGIATRR